VLVSVLRDANCPTQADLSDANARQIAACPRRLAEQYRVGLVIDSVGHVTAISNPLHHAYLHEFHGETQKPSLCPCDWMEGSFNIPPLSNLLAQ
jgi:hypothetical protein